MTTCNAPRFITRFVIAVVASAHVMAHVADQSAADAERLIKALDLRLGTVVAEIGAGDGELTVLIAKAVGDAGRVFSNELNSEKVRALQTKLGDGGVSNVTVVAGRANDTNLPEHCCDVVFMRDVYHHFSDPVAMNASILKALRPGGKLAVFEFGPPPGAESPDVARRGEDGQHGITPATLERELKAAGFEILATEEYGFRSSMTVARRPL